MSGEDEKKGVENQQSGGKPSPSPGATPGKAEGDEKTVDEALRNQEGTENRTED